MKPPFAALCAELSDAAHLASVTALVSWDQETYMPPRGAGARASQLAALSSLVHERLSSRKLGDLIAACEAAGLPDGSPEAACVREARRDYDRRTRLPGELVRDLAETASRAQEAWKAARQASDFAAFRPWLEKMIHLSRRKAECYGVPAGGELYDALLDEYEPGARAAELDAVFTPLRASLTDLVGELLDRGAAPFDTALGVVVPQAQQHRLGLEVIRALGFDPAAGRLDTTAHPFCSGIAPGDTRLTTRYREHSFADALFGTLHECGHGLYEQGLPKLADDGEPTPLHGTPLADAVSLGIHESQSRMWENFVGRSRAFWVWAKPLADRCFDHALRHETAETIYRACNTVERSYIRVEADEATYNLHVMLRFELERALISGSLPVADLPGAWNSAFERYLGVPVPDDRRGCLQDVHWSFGLIGYFPTYTLGNLYAAQFWETIRATHPDLDERIAQGDFSPVLAWNRAHVHQHGRRYAARELCQRATGQPLSAEPLLRHLRGKLKPIYGV